MLEEIVYKLKGCDIWMRGILVDEQIRCGAGTKIKQIMMDIRDSTTLGIKNVIYNPPATIVIWNDGSKTVVKCMDTDIYTPMEGLLACIVKRQYGNDNSWHSLLKKWLPSKQETLEIRKKDMGRKSEHVCKMIVEMFREAKGAAT